MLVCQVFFFFLNLNVCLELENHSIFGSAKIVFFDVFPISYCVFIYFPMFEFFCSIKIFENSYVKASLSFKGGNVIFSSFFHLSFWFFWKTKTHFFWNNFVLELFAICFQPKFCCWMVNHFFFYFGNSILCWVLTEMWKFLSASWNSHSHLSIQWKSVLIISFEYENLSIFQIMTAYFDCLLLEPLWCSKFFRDDENLLFQTLFATKEDMAASMTMRRIDC